MQKGRIVHLFGRTAEIERSTAGSVGITLHNYTCVSMLYGMENYYLAFGKHCRNSASALIALPLWEMAFFSSSDISARVFV